MGLCEHLVWYWVHRNQVPDDKEMQLKTCLSLAVLPSGVLDPNSPQLPAPHHETLSAASGKATV